MWEGDVEVVKIGSRKKSNQKQKSSKSLQRTSDSVRSRIEDLINQNFFANNQTIQDIIRKLQSKGYNFKSSQLTNPLQTIVRRGLLEKTKELSNGQKSKLWTYIKP